ncbi:MAG: hypothetical protein N2691_00230 [Patescibacteria group bacterium]|nr:hypothetical protein [Patescibacteria group bacterium]
MNNAATHNPKNWRSRMDDILSLEPNDLMFQPLTTAYKLVTRRLKVWPFLYIIPLSFAAAALLYATFGSSVVKLTSLLQYGF